MRYLIISDIHANYEALRAVLVSSKGDYDEVVCCGDLVGYGPDPDLVTDWVRENVSCVVRGNHDRACSGLESPDQFNEAARIAAYWTLNHLSEVNAQYLMELPKGPMEIAGLFHILHGSPRDEDEYVTSTVEAQEAFPMLKHPVNFFGHTHLQGGFLKTTRGNVVILPMGVARESPFRLMEVQPGEGYYVNAGSVGQPRDRDPRAAFAIFDTKGYVEYRRVPYDVETTIRKMQEAHLPEFLAYRLSVGR
jgi:predicted phosphodiesterase